MTRFGPLDVLGVIDNGRHFERLATHSGPRKLGRFHVTVLDLEPQIAVGLAGAIGETTSTLPTPSLKASHDELVDDPHRGVEETPYAEDCMENDKHSRPVLDVERQTEHAVRPGFRIAELRISVAQTVPWHYHTHIQDTFYVIEGTVRLFLRDPKEEVRLGPGETYAVRPLRPHLVTNGGDTAATFLVLQGIGEYDFVPLTQHRGGQESPSDSAD